MLFAVIYLLLRRLVALAGGSSEDRHNDIEVLVLRHQLAVLKRHVGRPRLRRRDRLFMAALSKVLPRPRWSSFLVSPQTLLRWHRELVRRKVDLSSPDRWRKATASGRCARAHPPDGEGEPPVGMRADQGRAGQARHQGLGLGDPSAPSRTWARAGTTTRRSNLVGVPAEPGAWHPGDRLLHLSVMMALLGGLAHFFTARSRGRGLSTKRRSPGTQDQPA